MKAYVMWSGGLDSTALIWHYLQRGYKVSAGYVAFRANVWQTKCELRAIDRMLPFLEQHEFKFKGVIGWFKWNYGTNVNLRRSHPVVTMTFCAMLNEDFDEMAIGIVRDDRVSKEDMAKLRGVFRSLARLMPRLNKLAFPLRRCSKEELLRSLPPQLREHLWTCDDFPGGKRLEPCGRCSRCQLYARLFRRCGFEPPAARKQRRAAKRR